MAYQYQPGREENEMDNAQEIITIWRNRRQRQLDSEPCGCPECDESVQPGHFACCTSNRWMLDLEREGAGVMRRFDGTSWVWEAI